MVMSGLAVRMCMHVYMYLEIYCNLTHCKHLYTKSFFLFCLVILLLLCPVYFVSSDPVIYFLELQKNLKVLHTADGLIISGFWSAKIIYNRGVYNWECVLAIDERKVPIFQWNDESWHSHQLQQGRAAGSHLNLINPSENNTTFEETKSQEEQKSTKTWHTELVKQ